MISLIKVQNITDTIIWDFIEEAERFFCGSQQIPEIHFCQVKRTNENTEVGVHTSIDVFSVLTLDGTEKILNENIEKAHKLFARKAELEMIDVEKLEKDLIKLKEVKPRDFAQPKFTPGQIAMISVFTIIGVVLLITVLVYAKLFRKASPIMSLTEIAGFVCFSACYLAFCFAVYYGVSGDLEWVAAGPIIGFSGKV